MRGYGWRDLEIKTKIQARNYKDKEKHKYQSRNIRLESRREVGSQEEMGMGYQLQNYLWQEGI